MAFVTDSNRLWGRLGGPIPSQRIPARPPPPPPHTVSDIVRFPFADPRMSPIVIHNGLIYLSGQVPDLTKLDESDITAQSWQTLAKVDDLLAQAGYAARGEGGGAWARLR